MPELLPSKPTSPVARLGAFLGFGAEPEEAAPAAPAPDEYDRAQPLGRQSSFERKRRYAEQRRQAETYLNTLDSDDGLRVDLEEPYVEPGRRSGRRAEPTASFARMQKDPTVELSI